MVRLAILFLALVTLSVGGCMSKTQKLSQPVSPSQIYLLSEEDERQKIKEAEQGNAEAAFRLALFYGSFSPFPDGYEQKELYWLERAAIGGHVAAQHNLATRYENVEGFKNSYLAKYWYGLAAKQGDELSQKSLNVLKKKGQAG